MSLRPGLKLTEVDMTLKDKIAELIAPPIENEGFELIELKLSRYKKNSRLQVFVDSDNGVNLGDCIRLTKAVEPLLEKSSLFAYGYVIEVSSPGLDRPLHTARDFRRRVGEKVRIFFNDAERPPLEGELVGADDRFIELQTEDGASRCDLLNVRAGKIII